MEAVQRRERDLVPFVLGEPGGREHHADGWRDAKLLPKGGGRLVVRCVPAGIVAVRYLEGRNARHPGHVLHGVVMDVSGLIHARRDAAEAHPVDQRPAGAAVVHVVAVQDPGPPQDSGTRGEPDVASVAAGPCAHVDVLAGRERRRGGRDAGLQVEVAAGRRRYAAVGGDRRVEP